MNSLGSSNRPSFGKEESGAKKKPKRRYVSRDKSEQGRDTTHHTAFPAHHSVANLSREERILLYENRENERKNGKVGKNNLPLNIFTDEEYKEDEIKGTKYEKMEIDGEMTD